MKNIKFFSVVILIFTGLFLSGCYTQIAMNDNGNDSGYDNSGNDSYGYNNDQNSQDYQTPADSAYGDQYDSLSQYEPNTINNYYFGYPRYWGSSSWSYYPSYSFGISWGFPYYNPYYWDPFGIWTYYPTYYNPYSYYGGYYNPYYNYGYYGYYGYYGSYYSGIINRTRSASRLRNNDGFRNGGDRGGIISGTNGATTISTVSSNRNEPTGRTLTNNSGRNGSVNTNNNRTSGRVEARPVENGRNNSGRIVSRQYYQMRRVGTYRNNNEANNRTNANRNNSNSTYNNQRNSGRYEAPRSYSPPQRTYSPPQRSYSPPPTRSSSPPPARTSSGSSSRGSSERRGR